MKVILKTRAAGKRVRVALYDPLHNVCHQISILGPHGPVTKLTPGKPVHGLIASVGKKNLLGSRYTVLQTRTEQTKLLSLNTQSLGNVEAN